MPRYQISLNKDLYWEGVVTVEDDLDIEDQIHRHLTKLIMTPPKNVHSRFNYLKVDDETDEEA